MDGSAVEVWNAATALGPSGTVGPDVPTGTAHLARLLRFHNAAMGGGWASPSRSRRRTSWRPSRRLPTISTWSMSPGWSGAWPPMGAISILRKGSTTPTARPPGRPGSVTARSNARSFAPSPPRPGTSGDALDPVDGRAARAPSPRCAAGVDGCLRPGRRGRRRRGGDRRLVGRPGGRGLRGRGGGARRVRVDPGQRQCTHDVRPRAPALAPTDHLGSHGRGGGEALRLLGSIRWQHETTW